jgi:hypothetical protein
MRVLGMSEGTAIDTDVYGRLCGRLARMIELIGIKRLAAPLDPMHAERIARLKQEIALHAKVRDKLKYDINQAALSCKQAQDGLDRAKRPLLQQISARLAQEIDAPQH